MALLTNRETEILDLVAQGMSNKELTGFNRLGFRRLETQRYQFNAHIGKSLFSEQDVLIINHNLSSNPNWIRRYHDEMVRINTDL